MCHLGALSLLRNTRDHQTIVDASLPVTVCDSPPARDDRKSEVKVEEEAIEEIIEMTEDEIIEVPLLSPLQPRVQSLTPPLSLGVCVLRVLRALYLLLLRVLWELPPLREQPKLRLFCPR